MMTFHLHYNYRVLNMLGKDKIWDPFIMLWGCWIRDVPISFGMDVWYCLGRDPYSSGLWECWMMGIFSILLLVLDTIDKWYSDN